MMLEIFVPDLYIRDYRDLNLEELKGKGIKALVIDIDNTLVPFDVAAPDADAAAFLQAVLDSGIKPVIISNNHEDRVATFLKDFPIDYYYESRKPLKKTYLRMMRDFDFKKEEVATIGDQLMTDVFGANRCGCYTILTHPLVKRDIFYTKPNRMMEKVVFYLLKKKGLFDRDTYEV